jgi:hypothetical protein
VAVRPDPHSRTSAREREPSQGGGGTGRFLGLLCLSGILVLLAYGGVLDNYFHEIDDALSLNGAAEGVYHGGPRFLPVHFAWLRLLHATFGANPRGYYLAGLLLHVLSATTLGLIVRRLCGRVLPAAVAVAAFAVFYPPHETVMWITASCGLLSVLFVLLATLAWDRFLVEGARRWFLVAVVCALLAMGSKEDSVVLAPLLLGLDGMRNGALWRRGFVRRYAGFAALGAVYVAIALRPANWPGAHHGGRYDLRPELAAKLVANYALLFWPRSADFGRIPIPAVLAGVVLLAVLGGFAWRFRRSSPLVVYGLVVSVFGLLPVLPSSLPLIAHQRFSYPCSIGIACLASGFAIALQDAASRPAATRRRRLGAAALLSFAAWIAIQIGSVRSIERWRFDRHCARFENAMRSSATAFSGASGTAVRAVVVAPGIWDPEDYVAGLHVFVGLPKDRASMRYVPVEDVLRVLEEEAWFTAGDTAVLAGDADGSISAVRSREELPVSRWERIAAEYSTRGFGRTVALVEVRLQRR